jgi:hypothetical protein
VRERVVDQDVEHHLSRRDLRAELLRRGQLDVRADDVAHARAGLAVHQQHARDRGGRGLGGELVELAEVGALLRRRLLLARDRFGKKPLYYTWDGRRLVFWRGRERPGGVQAAVFVVKATSSATDAPTTRSQAKIA